ncbi:hypothetical protein VC83_07570 [Pseudogymnoascus destructans]|uniref:Uncharacterized protein n=1 Tax=Pseudogymnoascus destructans TaxID=655981 RepID=A0A177A1P4_9PEZI|nr:uncharacterized protein VC83_07570 [Pseudogymnoascus destructans]OAF55510.1 hypothetical protein VC83_07570 [Pseudogymnoascus destructans]
MADSALRAKQDSEPIDMVIQLIELLRNVPAFPKALPRPLSILANYSLMVECNSEWITTNNPDCDQPVKIIKHYQIPGLTLNELSLYVHERDTSSEDRASEIGGEAGSSRFYRCRPNSARNAYEERKKSDSRMNSLRKSSLMSLVNPVTLVRRVSTRSHRVIHIRN